MQYASAHRFWQRQPWVQFTGDCPAQSVKEDQERSSPGGEVLLHYLGHFRSTAKFSIRDEMWPRWWGGSEHQQANTWSFTLRQSSRFLFQISPSFDPSLSFAFWASMRVIWILLHRQLRCHSCRTWMAIVTEANHLTNRKTLHLLWWIMKNKGEVYTARHRFKLGFLALLPFFPKLHCSTIPLLWIKRTNRPLMLTLQHALQKPKLDRKHWQEIMQDFYLKQTD